MPSPIGHALGGIAVGTLVASRPGWRMVAACAVAAALPDVDFLLPLQHRGPTHSAGATALVFAASLAVLAMTSVRADRVRMAAAVALAFGSHIVLDWLGADSSAPRGVMALWPVSSAFYVSGLDVFNAVDRRYWLPGFWTRNTLALLREVVILGPLALISASAGRRVRSYRSRGATPPQE
jgi:inner membrane protein